MSKLFRNQLIKVCWSSKRYFSPPLQVVRRILSLVSCRGSEEAEKLRTERELTTVNLETETK